MPYELKVFVRQGSGPYRVSIRLATSYFLLSNLHTLLPPKHFRWARNTTESCIKIYLVPFEDVLPSIPKFNDIHRWKQSWKTFVQDLQTKFYQDPTFKITSIAQLELEQKVKVPAHYQPYLAQVCRRFESIAAAYGAKEALVAQVLKILHSKPVGHITAEGAASAVADQVGSKLQCPTFLLNPIVKPFWGLAFEPKELIHLDTGRRYAPQLDRLSYEDLWSESRTKTSGTTPEVPSPAQDCL